MAFALEPVVDQLKINGVRTDPFLSKAKQLQKTKEAGCFVSRDGLKIQFDKWLRIKTSGLTRDVVSETAVMKTLKKQLSTYGVYKFADVIGAESKEPCD